MQRSLILLAPALAAALAACAPQTPNHNSDPSGDGLDCDGDVCVLTGTITDDLTLTKDKAWLLRGGVFVGDDAGETVLTIEPGTWIYGETATRGMLVIRRGSKILAEGTAEEPIVLTSSKEEGQRARGDWGGLILNGRAPVNGCDAAPCESFGEGGTGFFGGDDAADNSGVLKYVRVEFAGQLISPDNELNGIAFQGVGSGTTVDFIQVHMGADDGVEFFGGTVNVKHVLTTGIADDNLDWTDGWQGKVQFFVAQQYDDAGDNGIEADNNGEDNAAAPRSHPVLSNLTLIGSPNSDSSDVGMLLREGTAANLHNVIVQGFNDTCLDVDHAETFANAIDAGGALTGELTLSSSIFDCVKNFDDGEAVPDEEPVSIEELAMTLNEGNAIAEARLEDPFNPADRNFRPAADSPALSGAVVPSDAFFEQVSFKGGVDPEDDWTAGWTVTYRN